MQFGINLQQKLQQNLSQEVIQTLQVLSLSTVDLREEIFSELEQNPILEIVKDPLEKKRREKLKTYIEKNPQVSADDHQRFLESIPDTRETLQVHLLAQFRLLTIGADEQILGEMLIQNLDNSGFHITPPEEILYLYNKTYPDKPLTDSALGKMIKEIQALDPIACCTSDSLEALQVQAHLLFDKKSETDFSYSILLDILDNHRDLFKLTSKGAFFAHLKELDKKYAAIKQTTVDDIFEIIATLSPNPGVGFSVAEKTNFAIPEIFVYKAEDGFLVEVNSLELPVLRISKTIEQRSSDAPKSQELKAAIDRANSFIDSLQYRRETMLKLANAIVAYQNEFFTRGPAYLKPLSQKKMADELKLHPSTISRSVNEKYLQCDWGLFELKHFFSNSTFKNEETNISKNEILEKIEKLIEENSKITDIKIAEILQENGVKISRRTINKYRNIIIERRR